LAVISLIGSLWLFLLCFTDTFEFAINLLAEDVKLIEESEEEKNAHINALKDGSIDYSKFNKMYGKPTGGMNTKGAGEKKGPVGNSNNGGKVGNPIKQGICDTTLKLLKITLKMMKEDYLHSCRKDFCFVIIVPVELVIKEMYKNLCIQEHINKVCLGIHYEKDQSFFETYKFERIVKEFSLYEERESNLLNKKVDMKGIVENILQRKSRKKQLDLRTLFWKNKLKNFILKSDEKWILDQYNQIKRFCIESSVRAYPTAFSVTEQIQPNAVYNSIIQSQSSGLMTSAGTPRDEDYLEK